MASALPLTCSEVGGSRAADRQRPSRGRPTGEIARDVVQFNENSLWAGSNNYANGLCGVADDVFDTSMHGFGRYLDFGQ